MAENQTVPRRCKRFYCERRGGEFCCADCKQQRLCEDRCMNSPVKCGLADNVKEYPRRQSDDTIPPG